MLQLFQFLECSDQELFEDLVRILVSLKVSSHFLFDTNIGAVIF